MTANKIIPATKADLDRMLKEVADDIMARHPQPTLNPAQALVERAKQATTNVNRRFQAFLESHKDALFNTNQCKQVVAQYYLDEFSHWSKDELLFITAMLHTEITMEQM